ncbi:hypothetical protein CH373_13275 [Leptospira perolatii]|uniref:DUF3352 domain-containing protein n=1 Tax=Leptospira perolatii TaxID=2023191 RepID=A0A2M9ZKS4_9LEPT|nr:hypothetical protein [Leptospira perolatii]PJZ69920.1 hypothetical protein CH360_08410 [Leptospira perolatii]PJZ72672.1 hypothetical protein CH373_13275 [Leptospira perolatii]
MKTFFMNISDRLKTFFESINSKYLILDKIQVFKNRMLQDPWVGVPIGLGSVFLIITFYLLFSSRYSIDSSIKDPAFLIPKEARYLVEIYRPEEFIDDVSKTSIGKSLAESGTFRKLLTLPELRKVSSVLYLLESKTGFLADPSKLAFLFDGPVALALVKKENWILIGKAATTSKLGVNLLTGFRGEKIKVPDILPPTRPTKKQETSEGTDSSEPENGSESVKTHSADDFTDQFVASSEKFGNLNVLKYEFGASSIYVCILGDFLILTDSDDLLDESLSLGNSKNNSSIASQSGFSPILSASMKPENKVLLYAGRDSIFFPILVSTFDSGSGALLLGWSEDALLRGNLYKIGSNPDSEGKKEESSPKVAKVIPRDASIVFYSEKINFSKLAQSSTSYPKDWEGFQKALGSFWKSSGISSQEASAPGLSVIFHGLDFYQNMIYPRFGFVISDPNFGEQLLQGIFKVGNPKQEQYQNLSLTTYPLKKGGYYLPSALKVKEFTLISSDRKSMEEVSSATNGNRPTQADIYSLEAGLDLANLPHHLSLWIPGILQDLRSFYLYGSVGSSEYSSKTIDSDIQPLLNIFQKYDRLILSFGSTGKEHDWGKLRVIER